MNSYAGHGYNEEIIGRKDWAVVVVVVVVERPRKTRVAVNSPRILSESPDIWSADVAVAKQLSELHGEVPVYAEPA
eukprot:1399317-Amphidinium_carterae.1